MGLSALPSFSRRHRVPAENRNEDEKPGAFAPQRRESLACSSSPLLVLVLRLISASFQCLRIHILHLAPAHWNGSMILCQFFPGKRRRDCRVRNTGTEAVGSCCVASSVSQGAIPGPPGFLGATFQRRHSSGSISHSLSGCCRLHGAHCFDRALQGKIVLFIWYMVSSALSMIHVQEILGFLE